MSFINPQSKQINCKIIYFGPALSGKSTTLKQLQKSFTPSGKSSKNGRIKSLSSNSERTDFFDFVPLSLGKIRGQEIRFHLYAIPGQILYQTNRRLLLKGIDGIVFVVDSQLARIEENLYCLQDLEENLRDEETFLEEIPFVLQYNKQDLGKSLVPTDRLNEVLNPNHRPAFESVATKGEGIAEPLQVLAKQVLQELHYPD